MALHIVLVEPEVARNASIIARACASFDCILHIVKPVDFSFSDRDFTHGGGGALEYWPYVKSRVHNSFDDFMKEYGNHRMWVATTKGTQYYSNVEYRDEDMILFGKDSTGLSEDIINNNIEYSIRIPVSSKINNKPLSLSTATIIVMSEALRQLNFLNLV